jgi:WhiB family redox-sensing transcriptional regulator
VTRSWRSRAACVGVPIEVFFPPGNSKSLRRARALCAQCPVVDDCLEWMLGFEEQHGFAAGRTSWERLRLLRATRHERDPFNWVRDLDPVHGTIRGYYAHRREGEKACPRCAETMSRWCDVDEFREERRRREITRERRGASVGEQ